MPAGSPSRHSSSRLTIAATAIAIAMSVCPASARAHTAAANTTTSAASLPPGGRSRGAFGATSSAHVPAPASGAPTPSTTARRPSCCENPPYASAASAARSRKKRTVRLAYRTASTTEEYGLFVGGDRVSQFWGEFVAATGIDGEHSAWGFGNTPEMMTELGLLVRNGPKRATASLRSWYDDGDPMPRP